MKKIFRSIIAVGIMFSLTLSVAGCKKDTPADAINADYEWLDSTYTDTSDLSDYAGKNQMSLVAWNVTGEGGSKQYTSSENIVYDEIKRVTGVTISDKSFDNGGMLADVKYTQLLATNDLPDIAYGSGWIDTDAVYDLTDLIDKYCPTIKSRMPKYVWNNTQVNGGQKGKVYGIPTGLGNIGLSQVDPLASSDKTFMFEFANEYYPYIVVRDDILKEAYPDAKTADEIDELFAKNGKFTEEELFDVEITSAEQFRTEFLPKIAKVIKTTKRADGSYKYQITDNRWVEPMLITEGQDNDNWSFLGVTIPKLLGATGTHYNTYFSYWDAQTQQVELMMAQDYYKQEVYEWAKLIAEGNKIKKETKGKGEYLVSDDGMDRPHATIQQELNSGYQAIGYMSSMLPSGNQATYTSINGETETVKYRKVYLKIEKDDRFEFMGSGEAAVDSVMIFKDSVSEDKLPQILMWLDYQCSRLADKLYAWGSRSAGLFEENAGIRTYKNEELANQMVYSTATMGGQVQKYNLSNGTLTSVQPVFPFFYAAGSVDHPKCSYDLSKMTGLSTSYFSSAVVCTEKNKEFVGVAKRPGFYFWTASDMEDAPKLFSKRKLVEDQLTKILLAGGSQSQFDAAYSELDKILNNVGWTDSFFHGKFTNKFLEYNQDYLDKFYKK